MQCHVMSCQVDQGLARGKRGKRSSNERADCGPRRRPRPMFNRSARSHVGDHEHGSAAAVGRQSGAKIHPQGKWFYPSDGILVRHSTSLLKVGPSCPDACHITRRKEGAREGGRREGGTDNVCRIRACKYEEGSLSDVCRPPPQLRLTMFLPSPRSRSR